MSAFNELVSKLEELFEMDKADLDFGIHRIIKSKHKQINDYLHGSQKDGIQSRLYLKVRQVLSEVSNTENHHKLEELRQKIKDDFGNRAFDEKGNLVNEDAKKEDSGKDYLQLLEAGKSSANIEQIENEVYSHLYEFFSRYYEEGDFLSLRRHSDKSRYAIPYNGEEVVLHWANKDQYYIKSSEDLKDYVFTIDEKGKKYRVRFHLTRMDAVQNNNKAIRGFVFDNESACEMTDDSLVIPVFFKQFDKKPTQKSIIEALLADIEKNIKKEWKTLLWENDSTFTGTGNRTIIEKHLQNYTKKNTSDYFIHKNLKVFLNQELDFYVKNEVMYLDDIDNRSADYLESEIVKIKAIRLIAKDLIDFLSQFEDFQKKLWLKKKFIIETNYCITLDRIIAKCPELIDEIVKNKEQLAEWQRLFNIIEKKPTKKFIEDNPYLVLDTAFFSTEFKYKILASMEDIDEDTNGLLIHGENFQALNLLQDRYREQVKCVYIDPPYNSPSSEIAYKNNFKHSSWLSLMENRLGLSRFLNTYNGTTIVAIDKYEHNGLFSLLNQNYENHDIVSVTVEHNKKGTQGDHFSFSNEYAIFVMSPELYELNKALIPNDEWEYSNLRNWGGESLREDAANCFYPILIKDNNLIGFGNVSPDDYHPLSSNIELDNEIIAIYPIDDNGIERKWRYARQTVDSIKEYLKIDLSQQGNLQIKFAKAFEQLKTVWTNSKYNAGDNGTKILTSMGFSKGLFDFPKSIYTVRDCIFAVSNSVDIILDYFAGSGTTAHAVIDLNREDEGRRKYILVEMGEYFDSVTKPRIQKVIYATQWKDGKPQKLDEYIKSQKKVITDLKKEIKDLSGFETQDEFDFEKQRLEDDIKRSELIIKQCEEELNIGNDFGSISHCFKYIRLENYEDSLNNLELEDRQADLLGLGDSVKEDYLLRYMLDVETSKSLINLDRFEDPFNSTLKIYDRSTGELVTKVIDLPETFNYLLGLRVRQLRYLEGILTYEGENPAGETVLVIWRNTKEKNNKELEKFVTKTLRINTADTEYRAIYINGDTTLADPHKKIILLEDAFHKLMFDIREL